MANSAGPGEMAIYEPSHLNLHYLQKYLFWSLFYPAIRMRTLNFQSTYST